MLEHVKSLYENSLVQKRKIMLNQHRLLPLGFMETAPILPSEGLMLRE